MQNANAQGPKPTVGFTLVRHEVFDAVPGAILFVAAHVEHRFIDIEEDLTIVVFFSKAPPEEIRR